MEGCVPNQLWSGQPGRMFTPSYQIYSALREHPRLVIAFWVAILVAAIPFTVHESDHLTAGGFTVPGSQSSDVERTLAREFPKVGQATLVALLWPQAGATATEMTAGLRHLQHAVRGVSGVELSQHDLDFNLFAAGLTEPLFVPLEVHANSGRAQDIAHILRGRLGLNRSSSGRVEIHLLGESGLSAGLQDTFKRDLASTETVGLPILFIVLLLVFGSLSAAILPIILGAVAVSITGALIYFLSLITEMSVFVTNTASMLGIGVAVDYSLIILSRVRQELQAGHDLSAACQIALRTSGNAVIVSGITVMAALIGLWLVPIGALRSLAVGALLVVAVSVIVSVTLLPALIMVLGDRRVGSSIFRDGAKRLFPHQVSGHLKFTWNKWARIVTQHPLLAILITGSMLVALCIPVLNMQTGTGTLRQLSSKSETRLGYIEAAKVGGVGSLGPIYVTVGSRASNSQSPLDPSVVGRLRDIAKRLPDVHKVGSLQVSHDGRYMFFSVIPTVDPESSAAESLVQQLRRTLTVALKRPNTSIAVGGTSATQLDLEHEVATSMWKVIVVVMTLIFIVLMTLLRSILLPLKAVVMSLLSVGVAYGILVVVFQWGWLDTTFHYHSLGYLDTLTLPLILAIVLGLSMDYEVFLLSRIKEQWVASKNSRLAVTDGLAASAKAISSAALVLVCVFAVFVGTGIPSVKELGLGVAVAIFIDATLIRLILVPATMRLFGDWSWWLPASLERILPTRDGVTLYRRPLAQRLDTESAN